MKSIFRVLMLCGAACMAHAQTTTGQITGVVQDTTRAVISGAAVTVTQVETGLQRENRTNELGYYAFPLLPPGTYKVVVQQEGFRPVSQTGIVLNVNEVARVDVVLEVGGVAETVEVTASAVQVERESAALGTVMDGSKIVNLPLNSRNPFSLALLAPGVIPGAVSGISSIPRRGSASTEAAPIPMRFSSTE